MTTGAASEGAGVHVLLIDGSPTGGGRTGAALAALGAAAAQSGAHVELLALGDDLNGGIERAVAQLAVADAVALGSPVYRATAAAPLKQLIDVIPRTNDEERDSPLAGKAVAIVHTGATLHHFLASNALRDVLAGFFAAHVLPPGLYVPREGFGDGAALLEPYADQAHQLGSALVELAVVLRNNSVLRSLRPQA
jgi:NAD(P)H-dependent FMN reductase